MLGPAVFREFEEIYRKHASAATDEKGQYIVYGFGGQPDVAIGHVFRFDHVGAAALASAMGSMIPRYGDGICPDCNEYMAASAVDDSACNNCGHVFSAPRQSDGPDDG